MASQTFMIINRHDGDYCLAIRGDKVVIALSNPFDPYLLWIRKDTGSNDEEGQPTFALVNKGSNEAIRHDGTSDSVSLILYNESSQDNAVFWSESKNGNDGFKYIRRTGALSSHITAYNHKIEDGRIVYLSNDTPKTGQWKLVPCSMDQQETNKQRVKISCSRKPGYNLTIRKDTVLLAPADSNDKNQIWIKDSSYSKQVKDEDKQPSFALINEERGKAIKHGFGQGYLVQLVTFNPNYLDSSLLWTEKKNRIGFQEIRMQSNTSVLFHAFYVSEQDSNKPLLALRKRNRSDLQSWNFDEIM